MRIPFENKNPAKLFSNLPIERKLLLVSAVPIFAIIVLSFVTYKSVQTFSDDEDRLNHVYHVQSAAAEYMRLVVDIETGFRGFVLTKQDQFLQPYQSAKTRVLKLGQSLKQMVQDEEAQRIHVEGVQKRVQQLMDEKDKLIQTIEDGESHEAIGYIESGKGRALMLAIREEMDRFDRREVELLRQALASSSEDRAFLMAVVVGGGAFAFILMVIPIHLIARSITGPLTSIVKTVGNFSGGRIPEVPILERSDEIGDLTRVMQVMNTQIHEHIQRVEQSETELRALNQDLAASEAKYRGIVDHAPIGIFTFQGNRMIFSNRQNWILAGKDPEGGLDPEEMWETIHPDDREGVRQAFAAAMAQGVPFERVYRFFHENGAVRKVLSRAIPIKNDNDEIVAYQGFNVDITVLEQMRLQLSRAERLATLGQVAAGIAHEIRNPLVGIGSTASLLMDEMHNNDSKAADLNTILRETRRLDRIVNQIVEYAKPREINPVSFSVGEVVNETLALLDEPLRKKHIRIEYTPMEVHLLLQGDRDQIKQVLLNAIQNSLEASPTEGTIQITTSKEPREGEVGVLIRIEDKGKGIAPSNISRIFDPFFTFGKQRGTGLGLAICRNIIEAHGGNIHAESQLGQGTIMSIWLPLSHLSQLSRV